MLQIYLVEACAPRNKIAMNGLLKTFEMFQTLTTMDGNLSIDNITQYVNMFVGLAQTEQGRNYLKILFFNHLFLV